MTFATVAVFKEQDPGYILYIMYNYRIFGHILGFVFFCLFFLIYLMTMEDHVDVKVFLFVLNIFGYMFISLFYIYFMYLYN